jgi:hypothetical protein
MGIEFLFFFLFFGMFHEPQIWGPMVVEKL